MSNAILNHTIRLTRYRALRYFARLPPYDAESGSLALCTAHFILLPSDPAVTSNALATLIVFPLVGVTPACRRLGLPAMPGKQKAPLQEAALIETRYGKISAELVMFYNDELLKKLFPLNGKLSGYWGEKDEYALAGDLELQLPCGTISAKVINLVFYKNGNIKSLTLWPQEAVEVTTPAGLMRIKVGIAFYEDGAVKSIEPAKPYAVDTKIGKIWAYDNDPEGIMGDINSLQFDRSGAVTALCTTNNVITVNTASGEEVCYAPSEKESLCSEGVGVTVPLQIEFTDGKIRFNKSASDEYNFLDCTFDVTPYEKKAANPFYVCS